METKGLKQIGKGLFSKVYRLNENEVLIKSICQVKECISNEWHNSVDIFPELKRVEDETYICEYYDAVKSLKESLNPEHYAIYKELRSLSVGYVKNPYDLYSEWYKQFETLSNIEYKEALLDMIDNLSNYGSQISFEISPRNVAVKEGRLILLDVFFMQDQANHVRGSKSKVRYYN